MKQNTGEAAQAPMATAAPWAWEQQQSSAPAGPQFPAQAVQPYPQQGGYGMPGMATPTWGDNGWGGQSYPPAQGHGYGYGSGVQAPAMGGVGNPQYQPYPQYQSYPQYPAYPTHQTYPQYPSPYPAGPQSQWR
jgi:hypothetical protein